MCLATDNPTSCEIRAVVRFLYPKNMSASEIHRELCAVYGQTVMSEGTVRKWCRMFKDGRPKKCSWWSAKWSTICSERWTCSKWRRKKNLQRQRFTISELPREFPQISRNLLYEIITVRLGYNNFCARRVPKMLSGAHKTQRMAPPLNFLAPYHKDGDEFLNHIVRVTGDKKR
jgi:hypothetical protein